MRRASSQQIEPRDEMGIDVHVPPGFLTQQSQVQGHQRRARRVMERNAVEQALGEKWCRALFPNLLPRFAEEQLRSRDLAGGVQKFRAADQEHGVDEPDALRYPAWRRQVSRNRQGRQGVTVQPSRRARVARSFTSSAVKAARTDCGPSARTTSEAVRRRVAQ